MAGFSFNALAIENGVSVNWNDNTDFLKLYSSDEYNSCTGTLVAGKYALTAAHCLLNGEPMTTITSASGQKANIITPNTHPAYYDNDNGNNGNWHDVAVSELNHYVETQQIHFFADLTTTPLQVDEGVRVFGFGGTYEELNYARFIVTNEKPEEDSVFADMIATGGNTTGGDSGGPWLQNGDIVSIHKGSKDSTIDPRTTYSTNLEYSSPFILKTVNGWHYPTLAKTSNGSATITVQSLHQTTVTDSAHTSGDVQIVGGTCFDGHTITAYEKCTYVIESQGGEGRLILGRSDEVIQINKPVPVIDNGSNDSGSGESDGGSFGLFGLLSLLGFGFYRRK